MTPLDVTETMIETSLPTLELTISKVGYEWLTESIADTGYTLEELYKVIGPELVQKMMFPRSAVDLPDPTKEDSVTVWDNGEIVPVDDERYCQTLDEFDILTAQFGAFVITYSETFLLPETNEYESVRTVIYRHDETA